jgi:hypothetical protein
MSLFDIPAGSCFPHPHTSLPNALLEKLVLFSVHSTKPPMFVGSLHAGCSARRLVAEPPRRKLAVSPRMIGRGPCHLASSTHHPPRLPWNHGSKLCRLVIIFRTVNSSRIIIGYGA